jgi:prepilin-type N-terminal cleavage/methylation domain-containing protein
MINKLHKPTKAGFTLIEMLVAVLLLITAVAGPLTIASKGVTTSVVAKDQVTAFFLAQDAIEYIRHKRDTNRLAGNDWLTGLGSCVSADGSAACVIDSTENNPSAPTTCGTTHPETGCALLRYHQTLGRFTYQSGAGTIASPINMRRFVRIITPIDGNPDEAAIVVRMTWFSAQNTTALREIVVRENLLNWQ